MSHQKRIIHIASNFMIFQVCAANQISSIRGQSSHGLRDMRLTFMTVHFPNYLLNEVEYTKNIYPTKRVYYVVKIGFNYVIISFRCSTFIFINLNRTMNTYVQLHDCCLNLIIPTQTFHNMFFVRFFLILFRTNFIKEMLFV